MAGALPIRLFIIDPLNRAILALWQMAENTGIINVLNYEGVF
jgi:hypothetical protein